MQDYLGALLTDGPPAARCELVRTLPSDDFGVRMLARHRDDDRSITVRGLAIADAAWLRASRRLQALAAVQDVHAAALLAYGRHDGLAYFMHEHDDGPRLTKLLEAGGGRIDLRTLLPIFSQILLAVSDAHELGIVVGGVRPQDIRILRAEGDVLRIRIRNFGLATVLGVPAGRRGSIDHPSLYRAPEPDVSIDPASDVFSLAVLFVRLMTGPLPAMADTDARIAMLHERIDEAAREDQRITDHLVTLLHTAVDPDPVPRPANATAMLDQLRTAMPASLLRMIGAPGVAGEGMIEVRDGTEHWPARQWTVLDAWTQPRRPRSPESGDVRVPVRTGHTMPGLPPAPMVRVPMPDDAATRRARRRRRAAMSVGAASLVGVLALATAAADRDPDAASSAASSLAAAAHQVSEDPAPMAAAMPTVGTSTLIIETTPSDLAGVVTIDGVRLGQTPHRSAIDPGLHIVRVEAEGHRAWRSRVRVEAGHDRRVSAVLEPERPLATAVAVNQ